MNLSYITFIYLFFLSGFAGLIYESIWSRYLTLFLGHSAYAEMLVLIIFMGGLGLGAWLTGIFTKKIKNILLTYAIVELCIGLAGIFFHNIFTWSIDFTHNILLPNITSDILVQIIKWSVAGILIAPQCILLGATFPLMTGGILRHFHNKPGQKPGNNIATLYFINSLGGAIGIIASGFFIIPAVGLPGAVLTAGVINSIVAVIIILIIPKSYSLSKLELNKIISMPINKLFVFLILCSFFTGLASFLYEIAWIRMLSFVLGSSTHAFEIMLSTFILGLAIGSFWIRNKLDKLNSPIKTLGIVQVSMALCAVFSLVFYNQLFNLMQYNLQALANTDQAYNVFNITSHLLSAILMLPTTICAGMILPLITYILNKQSGEHAIGKSYAANTIGSILGAWLAVYIIMPNLGLKHVISSGVFIDLTLGIIILWHIYKNLKQYVLPGIISLSLIITCYILFTTKLDPIKMASGIFRYGAILANRTVLFHKDGKTSSIDLVKENNLDSSGEPDKNNKLILITNGKPDASITYSEEPSQDEHTQILLATIPWSINPSAKNAAVIGLGSGMTTNTLLQAPTIEHVDTIEIEPAMLEAAKLLGHPVEKTFNDKRSKIHIEDARTFFSNNNKKYDLIISEPSNTWVSGVPGLFTKEFYFKTSQYLQPSGLFMQWLHLYELNLPLVASIMNALAKNFNSYVIYFPTHAEIAIIASNADRIPLPSDKVFDYPDFAKSLSRINIKNKEDLIFRHLGTNKTLEPFFATFNVPENSDYFPYLDLNSVKSRFKHETSYELLALKSSILPIINSLEDINNKTSLYNSNITPGQAYHPSNTVQSSLAILPYLTNNTVSAYLDYNKTHMLDMLKNNNTMLCKKNNSVHWLDFFKTIMYTAMPYLDERELLNIWGFIKPKSCLNTTSEIIKLNIQLYENWVKQDFENLANISNILINKEYNQLSANNLQYLIFYMLAKIKLNQPRLAIDAWDDFRNINNIPLQKTPIEIRFLSAFALSKI